MPARRPIPGLGASSQAWPSHEASYRLTLPQAPSWPPSTGHRLPPRLRGALPAARSCG